MDLNQVTLPSQNLSKSAEFYRALGLNLVVDNFPSYVRFALPDGTATLSLEHVTEPPGTPGPLIYFECADLDARVESLRKQGIVFESGPEDTPWLWREARLRDPDGNRLCLFWAGENRLDPPWRASR